MDKLIPINVAVRDYRQKQLRREQQEQMSQKLSNYDSSTNNKDAFKDKHLVNAYAEVKKNTSSVNKTLIRTTTSSPYK